jgi:hypothetical protein
MKAHELLSSPETWCQEALAKDARGDNVRPFNPKAVQWCALAAVQKVYPPSRWDEAMNRVLRALSVSEKGIKQLSKSDKACYVWNGTISGNRPITRFERFFLRRTYDRPSGRGRRFSLNLQKNDFSKCLIEKN